MAEMLPRPAMLALCLASRSPRRAQLLRGWGYRFEQADPPFADPPQPEPTSADPADLAADLARQKAASLRGHVGRDELILAADTLCVATDGTLLGQPDTRDEARAMIAQFVGCSHAVITGCALLAPGEAQPTTFADTAVVTFGPLDSTALDAYLETGHWRGKAGGYNLFDRQAAGWPITVQGDPTTVVGLPMRMLANQLARHGIHPGEAR